MKERFRVVAIGMMVMVGTADMVYGQHGVNSIYSAYGVGDYQLRPAGLLSGMGGTGIALDASNTINILNPAGAASVPRNKFLFEFTTAGTSVQYVSSTIRPAAHDFSVHGAAFGLNLIKNTGTVFSLKRRTVVDYLTRNTKNIDGSENYLTDNIEGTGGLNDFAITNGVRIKKKLSLGFTGGFLFGPIDRQETLYLSEANYLTVTQKKYYNNFYVNFGAQYQFKTGESSWIAGAFYEPAAKLNTVEDNYIEDASGNKLFSEESVYGKFQYPQKWGAGLSWKKDRITLTGDYIGHQWSTTGYKGSHFRTTDAGSLAFGARYSFTRKSIWGDREGISLYTGFVTEKSYLIINNYHLKSNAFTLGISVPSFNLLHNYSAFLRAGSRGTPTFPLVKENFTEFGFIVNFGGYMLKGGPRYD